MGLGHFGGGVAVARWVAQQGGVVTVTDLADRETLSDSLAELSDVPIAEFHLGGHIDDDFRHAELVVVNPAVRPDNRFLDVAAAAGVPLKTEIELFIERCRAKVVGVTGSNGKSTTAAMIAAVLETDGRKTWLGGNIGGSLLEKLDQINPDDYVVLELSSFQLWHATHGARMPDLAVVTNCSPNHLNWHGRFEHYVAAKQRILTGQSPDGLAVLNTLDREAESWQNLARGRLLPPCPVGELPDLGVPGEHNRQNAACAAAAAAGIGCDPVAICEGLRAFRTLPGRLELSAVISGRRFYNDTTSTTPESTIAALEALGGNVWLLAGGSDKGIDFCPMTAEIAKNSCGAAFFGAVASTLDGRMAALDAKFPHTAVETMGDALEWAWRRSRPGDAIVLSPACASYDQFQNFRRRGEKFLELVEALS